MRRAFLVVPIWQAVLVAVVAACVQHWLDMPTAPAQRPPMARQVPHDHQPRSGHWPPVRAAYLEKHPACEACGSIKDLQVHHVLPFHLYPAKELDPGNLITLCGPGGHNCHLAIGHLFDYHAFNPHAREDAARLLARIRARRYARERGRRPVTHGLPGGQVAYGPTSAAACAGSGP